MTEPADTPVDPRAESFYGRAYPRIVRFMLAAAVAGTAAVAIKAGGKWTLGFVVGCAISFVNFYWLKVIVSAMADRITSGGSRETPGGLLLRLVLRYVLIAIILYVIFSVSLASVYGVLAGLALPVAGILCEAAYETYVALRRGL